MSTAYVLDAGHRWECLEKKRGGKVWIAQDGSIAIEVKARYVTNKFADGTRTVYEKEKLLIGDPFAINNSVEYSLRGQKTPSYNLQLVYFPRVSPDKPNWTIYPSDFKTDFVSIPVSFQGSTATKIPFEYVHHEKNYLITLGMWDYWLDNNCERREFREWWGYPCMIFVVPAVAVDIITCPFQIFYRLKVLGTTLVYIDDLPTDTELERKELIAQTTEYKTGL